MDSEEPFNESFISQDPAVLRRPLGQLGIIVATRGQGYSKPLHSSSVHFAPNTLVSRR